MANKKKRKRPASPPTAQPKGETAKKGVATAPRDKPRSAPARPTSSRRGRLSARSSWTLLGVGIVALTSHAFLRRRAEAIALDLEERAGELLEGAPTPSDESVDVPRAGLVSQES